jgi:hypothetical protein
MVSERVNSMSSPTPSSDVAVTTPILSATQLREMDFANAETILADTYGEALINASGEIVIPEAPEEIGDGFSITKDKDQFLTIRLLIVNYQFSIGDYETDAGNGEKGEFVTVWVISARGKHKFSDGSSGIYKQLREYYDRTGRLYLAAPNGLRKSEYTYEDPQTHKKTPAATYYIDTSR